MCKRLAFAIFFLIVGVLVLHNWNVTVVQPAAAQQKSTKPDPQSATRKLYALDCAICHGDKGDGKGDLGSVFTGRIPDFTDPEALKGYTDEQLVSIIKNGRGDMPPEGSRARGDEMTRLVQFVRTFSKRVTTSNALQPPQ